MWILTNVLLDLLPAEVLTFREPSQYVAFAALAIILNLFVRAHHLSKENEEVVLGTDRHEASAQQTDRGGDPEATKLRLRPSPHRS